MQKIATRVFIYSSISFGIIGILRVLTLPADGDNSNSTLDTIILKLLLINIFIILPSFALSVAGKYLSSKK